MKLQTLSLILLIPFLSLVLGSPIRRVSIRKTTDPGDEEVKRALRNEAEQMLGETKDPVEKVALRGVVAKLKGEIRAVRRF